MNDIIEFLTSKEIIVVYIVVAIAIFLCLVIYIVDKTYDKRKRKQNTRKLKRLVEDVNIKLEEEKQKEEVVTTPSVEPQIIENNVQVSEPLHSGFVNMDTDFIPQVDFNTGEEVVRDIPVVNPMDEVIVNNMDKQVEPVVNNMDNQISKLDEQIDEIIYVDPEPNKEEATRELLRLTEELEKAEQAQKNNIDIGAYEDAQEENAIISLDELTKRSEEMYAANEATQYDDGNEPISLEDLEKRKAQVVNSEIVEEPVIEEILEEPVEANNTTSGYKGTIDYSSNEIFSSVFDTTKREDNTIYQNEEELQKTSTFLLNLKDLQSKLNS